MSRSIFLTGTLPCFSLETHWFRVLFRWRDLQVVASFPGTAVINSDRYYYGLLNILTCISESQRRRWWWWQSSRLSVVMMEHCWVWTWTSPWFLKFTRWNNIRGAECRETKNVSPFPTGEYNVILVDLFQPRTVAYYEYSMVEARGRYRGRCYWFGRRAFQDDITRNNQTSNSIGDPHSTHNEDTITVILCMAHSWVLSYYFIICQLQESRRSLTSN